MKKASTTKAAQITVSMTAEELEYIAHSLVSHIPGEILGGKWHDSAEPIIKEWKAHRPEAATQVCLSQTKRQRAADIAGNDADVALAEKLLAQLTGKSDGRKEIPVSLTDEQHRVFSALADFIDAKVSPGEVLTGLAISALETGSMTEDAGFAHLDLSYRVLRARAGVMELDGTWPTGATAEGTA